MIDSTFWPEGRRDRVAQPLRWLPLPCMIVTSAAYAVLYALSNQLTSLRSDVGEGVFAWERAIPFLGWSVVPYLSICAFFVGAFFVKSDEEALRRHVFRLLIVLIVSVLCYAAFPLRFTFERPPTEGWIGLMFDLLGHCDMPYNRAPSLHIGVLVLLWARFSPGRRGWCAAGLHGWFALIALSVLTTYQHHVLDVPAGAALGLVAIFLTSPARRLEATPPTRVGRHFYRAKAPQG
jgi:membrane-associated phospholipid phosphatase